MESGEKFEELHVHEVYDAIAKHFSSTRYKPWPVIEKFLKEQPNGSVGADVGCGNGKYLGVNPELLILGSDRSANLIRICKERGFEAMVADGLNLPYRDECFVCNYCLGNEAARRALYSIREKAVEELLRITKPGGQILIFVWAFEQEGKRKFEEQDVFVPWQLQKEFSNSENPVKTYQRYYHMFVKGELDDLVRKVGNNEIVESGYDRDNWYIIATKKEL